MKRFLGSLIATTNWRRASASIAVGTGLVLLNGCLVGPNYKGPPTAQIPPTYKENSNWKVAQPRDEKLAGNWWETFGDPQLNTLEQQVNVSNQNLRSRKA